MCGAIEKEKNLQQTEENKKWREKPHIMPRMAIRKPGYRNKINMAAKRQAEIKVHGTTVLFVAHSSITSNISSITSGQRAQKLALKTETPLREYRPAVAGDGAAQFMLCRMMVTKARGMLQRALRIQLFLSLPNEQTEEWSKWSNNAKL
ncbi:hypothetical protein CBL_01816 [Carabus blaptoides fortunei]